MQTEARLAQAQGGHNLRAAKGDKRLKAQSAAGAFSGNSRISACRGSPSRDTKRKGNAASKKIRGGSPSQLRIINIREISSAEGPTEGFHAEKATVLGAGRGLLWQKKRKKGGKNGWEK